MLEIWSLSGQIEENQEKAENCDQVAKADEEQIESTSETDKRETEKVRGRQIGQKSPEFRSQSGAGIAIDLKFILIKISYLPTSGEG